MEVLQEGDGDDEDEEDGSDGEEEVETFGVDLSARPSRRKVTVKR